MASSTRPQADFHRILAPYNPWWEAGEMGRSEPVGFRRPVFGRIFDELNTARQILSITGPRRVGKTTLVRQAIQQLLRDGVPRRTIIYYSMDDPLLVRSPYHEEFFDLLVDWCHQALHGSTERCYVFLDEIQRYERWELFLKKYYDLNQPIRFVISGSASSPIFKKSRESLLGRVKDFHVLPFSFREYVLYQRRDAPDTLDYVRRVGEAGSRLRHALVTLDPQSIDRHGYLEGPMGEIDRDLRELLQRYLVDGGFPEVWEMSDLVRKQEYLFDNQVQKVIFEDLVLATEFRKPENVKAFYLSLIEEPGRELNLERASMDLGVSRPMLEKYFPLLEMTDLVKRLPRFTKRALKVRRGLVKCYLVDLALRNAVLKLGDRVLQDSTTLGRYAENLVFNVLARWDGIVALSYFRERNEEVDFIVTLGGGKYLAIEVKYQETVGPAPGLRAFRARCPNTYEVVVGRDWGQVPGSGLPVVPMHLILLSFDAA